MGKARKPFIDRKNASVYRLVHPTVHGDSEPSSGDGHEDGVKFTPVFQKVRGEVDYFSEEEEEEPYREDSGDEEEFGNENHDVACEEDEEDGDYEDGDEFEHGDGNGEPTPSEIALKRNVWLRSKEETMSEYSSWSSRSASSYLPPARRKQLWRDIEEFGLSDDGYDYTQHLRNAGAGVRIDAKMSSDLMAALERKRQMTEQAMSRAEREVVSLLYDSDEEKRAEKERVSAKEMDGNSENDSDEDAPPLEDEANAPVTTQTADGLKAIEYGAIVEEGDELPEDFVAQMFADDDDDCEADCGASAAGRASRLVDDQFEVMMRRYEDAEIGELPDEHPGLQGRSSVTNYYDILDKYIAAASAPDPSTMEKSEEPGGNEEQQGEELDEEERAELAAKTKALALQACEDASSEEEEVVPEEHEAWDCESILSTYSNLYNHPGLIRETRAPTIRLDPRTGAPRAADALRATEQPRRSAGRGDEEEVEEEETRRRGCGPELTRKKEETKEEKAARKQAAKEVKARALEKKREEKAAGRACKSGAAAPNAFDPRSRTGVSVRHLA